MTLAPEPIDGLVQVWTTTEHSETIADVLANLATHNVPLMARIDHAAAAKAAGLRLPPTELLIFGNASSGTPLMDAQGSIAIDLPLKLLVQQICDGRTRLSYNDPAWIARRHNLAPGNDHIISAMRALLASIAPDRS